MRNSQFAQEAAVPKNRSFWLGGNCTVVVPPRRSLLIYVPDRINGKAYGLGTRKNMKQTSLTVSPSHRRPLTWETGGKAKGVKLWHTQRQLQPNGERKHRRGCRGGLAMKRQRSGLRDALRLAYNAWAVLDRMKRLWGGNAGPWSAAREIAKPILPPVNRIIHESRLSVVAALQQTHEEVSKGGFGEQTRRLYGVSVATASASAVIAKTGARIAFKEQQRLVNPNPDFVMTDEARQLSRGLPTRHQVREFYF
jgi:hypothetical protein